MKLYKCSLACIGDPKMSDAPAVRYMLERAAFRERNQPKTVVYITGSKARAI